MVTISVSPFCILLIIFASSGRSVVIPVYASE
nr:MAG TPA: hypothetical protein [Caudoviricetes sp.]